MGAIAAAPAPAVVEAPPGGGKPTAGSGIGTTAALENPRCVLNERTEPYGRFSSVVEGGGPVCVKPWEEGDDNGGATSQGVTADRVKIVVVLPNESQQSALSRASATAPVNRADDQIGTLEDAVHDFLLPLMQYYETWGRDIEIRFMTSTGDDETAQRADAVTIQTEKPFAVINLVTSGLDVLDADVAKAEILVWGSATTTEKALSQAPYRWGLSDTQAVAVNAAEVIGQQLAGKKAEFAGDALKQQKRKFGAVYIPTLIDVDQFKRDLEGYGATLASDNADRSSGVYTGEAALAQEQAPVIVTRMKDAGVTTVVMFSDLAMNQAMMAQATLQEWYPEWFVTGALFGDLGLFARTYDQTQFAHGSASPTSSRTRRRNPSGTPREGGRRGAGAQLVLGRGGRDLGKQPGAESARVAAERDPRGRTQAHTADIPAGALLDPGHWRSRVGRDHHVPSWLRKDPRPAL